MIMSRRAQLLATAVGLCAVAVPARAQDAAAAPASLPGNTEQAGQGQEIIVTGSIFRRTDTETPSPVTTLDSKSIDERGLTTTSDVVQSVSAGNGGALPQNFLGAFASGAQSVSLRGLTTNSTLTLFDGLRPAYFPLADDGQRSIVDLNTIPAAIVDRVEVLRDGASATYGADAIAGVVNVILKKKMRGIEARAEAGVAERGDSANQRFQFTAGFGDLATQGFNVYVSGEYQHSDAVYAKDRGFPFSTNNLSSIHLPDGSTGRNGDVFFTPPTSASSNGAIVAVIRPATPTGTSADGIPMGAAIAGGQFRVLGSCASQNLITRSTSLGTWCEQDLVNQYGVLQPRQTRFGGTVHATVDVGSDDQAYVVANFYQSRIFLPGVPQSIRSNGNPIETRGIVLPVRLADGTLNPQNPYAAAGQAALIYYRFGDIPASLRNVARSYRFASGIDGKIGNSGFDYSVAATYMRTDLEQTRRGFLYVPGLLNAISRGTYNFIDPSSNSQAVRDSIAPVLETRANSELWQAQAVVTKNVLALPGGSLQVGVGGQIRYEAVYDPTPVPRRDFITVNPFAAIGNRYVKAAFIELNAPVLDNLEVNASGRFDSYSIGFSHFSPKIGAKFAPIRQLAIRGTYSEGFRAPSIPEVSGQVIGFTAYTPGDGLSAADKATLQARYGNNNYISQSYGIGLNSTGNPNIQPETSRAFTAGAVFQPVKWLSLTVDYYNIRKKNLILAGAGNTALIASNYLLNGTIPAGVTITPNPSDPSNPTLRPTPLSVNYLYSNGNTLQTSGIDAQIQAKIKLGADTNFTTTLEGTEILVYDVDDGTGTGVQKYVGTLASFAVTSASGTPRWRANWQNTIEHGPFTGTLTTYFVSGYKGFADDNTGPGSTCADAIETAITYNAEGTSGIGGGPLQCIVKHWLQFDAKVSFRATANFTFYLNVVNLFDAKAPFDPNTYGGNNYNPAWSSPGVIGRLFRAGAAFKF